MVIRRRFLQNTAAFVATSTGIARAQDPVQSFLAARAVPVRGVGFADDDFSDLEPLGIAIGAARVVQLGEPSHASGTAFAAKARIVKYLNQRHGFDVLIWESGLYDVAVAQAAMRDPAISGVLAAQKGVFTLWSQAAEVKPLFDYIKASQAGSDPLEMAGFDMQVTADGTMDRFAHDLCGFVDALQNADLRQQATALADQALAARSRLYAGKFSDAADLAALAAGAGSLRIMIAKRPDAFAAVHGALKTEFMDHCLRNMQSDAVLRAQASKVPQTTPARESRRDAWNAANLRWLLSRRYAGRKAIVWAHNVHVMNAYYAPGFRDLHASLKRGDMTTTGVLQKAWLGQQVYTLGVTAYAGEEGFAMGGPRTPIAAAPQESLEAHLHSLGHPFAFLDLRAIGQDRRMSRLPIRAPKFDVNILANPAQVYDGVFFIDQMAAATHA